MDAGRARVRAVGASGDAPPPASASPKPLCDERAKEEQPDEHHTILPMPITLQVGHLPLAKRWHLGGYATASVVRWGLRALDQLLIDGRDGRDVFIYGLKVAGNPGPTRNSPLELA